MSTLCLLEANNKDVVTHQVKLFCAKARQGTFLFLAGFCAVMWRNQKAFGCYCMCTIGRVERARYGVRGGGVGCRGFSSPLTLATNINGSLAPCELSFYQAMLVIAQQQFQTAW